MTSILLAATLFFAGDSTLDDNGFKYPYRSWGRETGFYMKAGSQVRNFAESGASTKSFRDSGIWAKLIAEVKSNDFVVIQFGHNDQKRSTDFYREKRWADPKGLFREIVRGWVAEVRARGATPILASPIRRGNFDASGRTLVDNTHASDGVCLGSYRDAMAELSKELCCDYVDMNSLTKNLMESVGRAEAEKFFVISTGAVRGKDGEPSHDVTHPAKAGAEAFAKLFVEDVRRRGLSVASLFREAEFPIDRFGAKPDGTKCTAAFAAAFDAAEKAGGGRVVVPKGRWFTGAIRLKSNCELHLSEGANVVFSQEPGDYLPAVFTSWEGMECWNYCPLVYAYGCTNVAITGSGTLRGYEGRWEDTVWYPWVRQENGIKAARLQLYTWGATDCPLERREIWKMKNANTRPHLVQFNRCRNVRWEGFRVRESPFWTLHLYQCEDVSVRGLDVKAHGNNNDGIDIEMSRNVLVEKCRFDQGDDGVVIKSGRNRDAWRIGRPTENVLIRDCEVVAGHTVLGIGSEISGGVRNVLMKDCTAGDVFRVFYLKTNRRRGGFLKDIACENVTARSARASVFEIATDILYEWASFPDYENRTTAISDIKARNLRVGVTKDLVKLVGDPAMPPERISWSGVSASSVTGEFRRVSNVHVDADVVGALAEPQWTSGGCNVSGAVFQHYYGEIVKKDAEADAAWAALKTDGEFKAHQARLRGAMTDAIGGFPERTPLNVRVVDTVRRDGYTIEKIVFESRPKFYVTAHRFVPDGASSGDPRPGVVVPCGHSATGKLAPWYQRPGVLGAKSGFVTVVYDPIEQGERRQLRAPADTNSTAEHNRCGIKAMLLGWNTAQFRIFDGMRAIDVLAEDPRVDSARIGVFGISGGGTLTSYLMALDDRVRAACPAGYLSAMRDVCDHCGPQDAEQNIFGQLSFGLNHLGYVLMRAPSPVLMSCTHADFFPFGGSVQTAMRARAAYDALGAGGRFDMFDVDGPHHWFESEQTAGIAWMRQQFGIESGAYSRRRDSFKMADVGFSYGSVDIGLADASNPAKAGPRGGWVTEKGSVLDLPGARNVYDIMRDEYRRLLPHRAKAAPDAVRSVAGFRPRGELDGAEHVVGTSETCGVSVRVATLVRPDMMRVPTVSFVPDGWSGTPVILVTDRARTNLVRRVRELLDESRPVMVAELRAFGETGENRSGHSWGFYGCPDGDEEIATMCVWLGASLVGDRAEDFIVAASAFAKAMGGGKIAIEAEGRAVIPAAHAFFAEKDMFSSFSAVRAPAGWGEMLENPLAPGRFANVVHGALRHYDWVDLVEGRRGFR